MEGDGIFKPTFIKSYWTGSMEEAENIRTRTSFWDYVNEMYRKEEFLQGVQYFNCYTVSCLVVDTNGDFSAKFSIQTANGVYVLMFVLGVALFIYADPLGDSGVVLYGVGALAFPVVSLYLPAYFACQKLYPSYSYAVHTQNMRIVLGAIVNTFLLLFIFFLLPSWMYLYWYLGITAFCGGSLMYQRFQVTNQRTRTIMSWALRSFGIILIFSGIQMVAVSSTIMLTLLTKQFYKDLYPFIERRNIKEEKEKRKLLALRQQELGKRPFFPSLQWFK